MRPKTTVVQLYDFTVLLHISVNKYIIKNIIIIEDKKNSIFPADHFHFITHDYLIHVKEMLKYVLESKIMYCWYHQQVVSMLMLL